MEQIVTATVCFARVFLSGQIIFLNSALRPLNQLVFFTFSVFSDIHSLPFNEITSFLCVMCVIYRIYSIFLFPYVPDEFSYPSLYCSYAVYILYMPMLFLCAQLPPRFVCIFTCYMVVCETT